MSLEAGIGNCQKEQQEKCEVRINYESITDKKTIQATVSVFDRQLD